MERELVVVDDLAEEAVRRFIQARTRSVALAGGSTPRPFYEALADQRYPWSEVHVLFGDERCVPPDHEDSNFRMANEALLSKVDAQVHRMPGESCDAGAYEDELHAVFGPGPPRLDLVVLGLGQDGHTASLFPGDPALEERSRLVVRVERPDHPRLTLTYAVLDRARLALFLVDGEHKREALGRLMADEDIPAARVASERVVVVADRAAASP